MKKINQETTYQKGQNHMDKKTVITIIYSVVLYIEIILIILLSVFSVLGIWWLTSTSPTVTELARYENQDGYTVSLNIIIKSDLTYCKETIEVVVSRKEPSEKEMSYFQYDLFNNDKDDHDLKWIDGGAELKVRHKNGSSEKYIILWKNVFSE